MDDLQLTNNVTLAIVKIRDKQKEETETLDQLSPLTIYHSTSTLNGSFESNITVRYMKGVRDLPFTGYIEIKTMTSKPLYLSLSEYKPKINDSYTEDYKSKRYILIPNISYMSDIELRTLLSHVLDKVINEQ